jgi:MoaA/NifB/PqqE/SkfB family radical SAM enzyme
MTRSENIALNAREFADRRVVLSSWPTMLYVELTQNCNLACNMCRSARLNDRALNMSDELFGYIASTLMPYAHTVDLRGWGESTILPELPARLRAVLASGARPRLVTNGLAMTAELWELFWEGDGVVAVSVDAASPRLFRDLGRGSLAKVLRNVDTGVALRNRCGHGTLYFTTTVSAFTLHELPSIIRMAAHHGVPKVFAHPIKVPAGMAAALSTVASEIAPALLHAGQVAREEGVLLQLGASLDTATTVTGGLPTTCASPWSHALICHNGDITFCDHLVNTPALSMGRLGSADFRAIWNGERFRRVRAAHVSAERSRTVGPSFRKCNWCYAHRYGDSEPAPMSHEVSRHVSTEGALPLFYLASTPNAAR